MNWKNVGKGLVWVAAQVVRLALWASKHPEVLAEIAKIVGSAS